MKVNVTTPALLMTCYERRDFSVEVTATDIEQVIREVLANSDSPMPADAKFALDEGGATFRWTDTRELMSPWEALKEGGQRR